MIHKGSHAAAALAVLTAPGWTLDVSTPLDTCEALSGLAIAAAAIGLPTVGEGGGRRNARRRRRHDGCRQRPGRRGPAHARPERCVITGKMGPVDPKAASIRCAVNLPKHRNGKALRSDGGGPGGQ
jgi:hypothetical protein